MNLRQPAGWYPDPDAIGSVRYWDGEAWTPSIAPAPVIPDQLGLWDGARMVALGILMAALALWVITGLLGAA